jgi:hypothetical protein
MGVQYTLHHKQKWPQSARIQCRLDQINVTMMFTNTIMQYKKNPWQTLDIRKSLSTSTLNSTCLLRGYN